MQDCNGGYGFLSYMRIQISYLICVSLGIGSLLYDEYRVSFLAQSGRRVTPYKVHIATRLKKE